MLHFNGGGRRSHVLHGFIQRSRPPLLVFTPEERRPPHLQEGHSAGTEGLCRGLGVMGSLNMTLLLQVTGNVLSRQQRD